MIPGCDRFTWHSTIMSSLLCTISLYGIEMLNLFSNYRHYGKLLKRCRQTKLIQINIQTFVTYDYLFWLSDWCRWCRFMTQHRSCSNVGIFNTFKKPNKQYVGWQIFNTDNNQCSTFWAAKLMLRAHYFFQTPPTKRMLAR